VVSASTSGKHCGCSIPLFGKPIDIPFAGSLGVLDDQLEAAEVECSDSVEADIQEDESPLEESVDGVCAGHLVDLVLDEEVEHRHKGGEEGATKELAVVDGLGVVGAQGDAADGPGYGRDEVRDHEDVVPVVVIGRCDIGPASTGEGSEDANAQDELGECLVGSRSQDVPQSNEEETRA
jgi:hypothetical protein